VAVNWAVILSIVNVLSHLQYLVKIASLDPENEALSAFDIVNHTNGFQYVESIDVQANQS